jgi:hypothetical protein
MSNEITIQILATDGPTILMENSGIDVFADQTQICEVLVSPMGERGPQGVPGQTGGIGSLIVNEVPQGVINGLNATFTTAFPFIPGTLEVFINGIKQSIVSDYQTIGTNIILLVFSPLIGESIIVNYKK